MNKIIQTTTCIFFFIWIFTPLLLFMAPSLRFEKLAEYRKPYEFPKTELLFTPQWTKEYSKWFDDNSPLRPPLTRIAGSLLYYLFNFSTEVYVGKDNYMFYRSVMDKELFNNHLAYRDTQLKSFFSQLDNIQSTLAPLGIKTILVISPPKWRLYNHNLPNGSPNITPDYFSYISTRAREFKDIIYIDSLSILQKLQNDGFKTFHATDFHWTDPAAYYVAREILSVIASRENISLNIHPLAIKDTPAFLGGQSRFLPLFKPITENTITTTKNWDDANLSITKKDEKPFEFISENSNAQLPPLAFYGNSFGDSFIRDGFDIYFKKIYKFDRGTTAKEILKDIPSDSKYFLIQIIEAQIFRFQ